MRAVCIYSTGILIYLLLRTIVFSFVLNMMTAKSKNELTNKSNGVTTIRNDIYH